MSTSHLWIATAPATPGQIGTGPVDLSIATQALSPGYDLPGGSGAILDRAYRWFITSANSATNQFEHTEHILGAGRALNNLAVWGLLHTNHADAGDTAVRLLEEAQRLLRSVNVGTDILAGVLFNLGQVFMVADQSASAAHYFGLARSFGFNVDEFTGGENSGQGHSPSHDSYGLRLDQEPDDAMVGGKTQRMFWAAAGDEDCVRELLERGADVDAVDNDGDTALLYAVSKGHLQIAELLLTVGASPNIAGDNGTPLRLVASRGWTEMVRILAAAGALLDATSTIMSTPGVTALMTAAGGGHVDCVRTLLELGADPTRVDSDGDDALFYARSNRQVAAANLLLTQ